MKITLTSISPLKIQAVQRVWPEAEIISISCNSDLPSQPFGLAEARFCAQSRLCQNLHKDSDLTIAIESFISETYTDQVLVILESVSIKVEVHGGDIPIDPQVIEAVRVDGKFTQTVGEYYQSKFQVPSNNWMKVVAGIDRVEQIIEILTRAREHLQSNR